MMTSGRPVYDICRGKPEGTAHIIRESRAVPNVHVSHSCCHGIVNFKERKPQACRLHSLRRDFTWLRANAAGVAIPSPPVSVGLGPNSGRMGPIVRFSLLLPIFGNTR